jgi:acetyl esterase/lipase
MAVGAEESSKVTVDPDGTVHIPRHAVPLSIYMSDEAKRVYVDAVTHPPALSLAGDIVSLRKSVDELILQPKLAKAKAAYAVSVEEQTIAGIRVTVVTPRDGVAQNNRDRVLINLHGGGFTLGFGALQLLESIPVAATVKIKVISVDYRLAPEHRFPAASEDIASVYQALLASHNAQSIGLYGGALVAMSLAWFQKENLPNPGAVGIFSPGDVIAGGDSRFLATPLHPSLFGANKPPPAPLPNPPASLVAQGYIAEADLESPLLTPTVHPQVIAQFPPTLLVTGTRDLFASPVIHLHRQLVKAGVDAELHIWEGMWHGSMQDVDLPESKEMYDGAARFFDTHLAQSDA